MKRQPLGFTLIELMVALGVIAIILSLSLYGISNARVRSRDAKRIADLQTIQSALEQHVLGDPSRSYPPDDTRTDIGTYCGEHPGATLPQKGLYNNVCFRDYLSVVPYEPQGDKQEYLYRRPGCFVLDGTTITLTNEMSGCYKFSSGYGLHTTLESPNHPEGKNDATPDYPQSYDLIP